jgi:hypothetical protein
MLTQNSTKKVHRRPHLVAEENDNREFVRVMGTESAMIPSLNNIKNLQTMAISEFTDLLNTSKGLL